MTEDRLLHDLRGTTFRLWQQVGVDLLGGTRLGVSEPALHGVLRHSVIGTNGCRTVAGVVQHDDGHPCRDAQLAEPVGEELPDGTNMWWSSESSSSPEMFQTQMSDDGSRLFFSSKQALLPGDTDVAADVYSMALN